jgi:prolyl-tRNA synthetase
MKDLYTFDYNTEEALKTYEEVRHAYMQLFNELKVPYLVATADSGNMGGNLSHEFHIISSKGEDTVISCSQCDHVHNEEIADGLSHGSRSETSLGADANPTTSGLGSQETPAISTGLWMAISKDKKTLIRGWYPKYLMQSDSAEPIERQVNSHAVKAITKAAGVDLDSSVESSLEQWVDELKREPTSPSTSRRQSRILDLYDCQVRSYSRPPLSGLPQEIHNFKDDIEYSMLDRFPGTSNGLDLVRVVDGDKCPKCKPGTLRVHSAIELGHTFHLGTRYSEVLQASVAVERSMLDSSTDSTTSHGENQIVPMQMGCHGIGVSRMVSAVADVLSDSKGLNWPKAIAPYEVVVVPAKGLEAEAEKVYDVLTSETGAPIDAVLDDRDKQIGWKLGDADLIGYPVIVVVGKGWKQRKELEVQCRRLDGLREQVPIDRLSDFVRSLLDRL